MKENNLIGILMWIVGIIVSLAVGFGMINEVLVIPRIPPIITIVSGWIVVIGAIISAILSIFKK